MPDSPDWQSQQGYYETDARLGRCANIECGHKREQHDAIGRCQVEGCTCGSGIAERMMLPNTLRKKGPLPKLQSESEARRQSG